MSLPLPPHFDASSVGRVYRVPYGERADEARRWAGAHGITPAADDSRRVGLLLVDVQNTFCVPGFELFVAGRSGRGATDDNARLAAFIYRNLGRISEIVATLDTHGVHQIFHPLFWVDDAGAHPAPHTIVTGEDVERGVWRVNPRIAAAVAPRPGYDMPAFARHYVERLAAGGKYPLTVWPYHAILGGIGHALVSAVEEAVFFHSVAREQPTRFEMKGAHALTENYSVLEPEVDADHEGRSLVGRNDALVEHLLGFHTLIVAGQAKSHCVAWTVADLLSEIERRDPSLARRVYLLTDCTSAVCVPEVVDYTDAADAAFERFARAGMRLVRSTDGIDDWRRS